MIATISAIVVYIKVHYCSNLESSTRAHERKRERLRDAERCREREREREGGRKGGGDFFSSSTFSFSL